MNNMSDSSPSLQSKITLKHNSNTTPERFYFELKEKTVGELVLGEVIFVPKWETRANFDALRSYEVESSEYQNSCKHLISECGYMVVRILDHSVVLFPLAKMRIDKRIMFGLKNEIISTGKIVKQY